MTGSKLPRSGLLTVAEIAEELRVVPMTVYRLISSSQLEAHRIGTRTYRVPAEAYHAYREQLAAEARTRSAPAPVPVHPSQLTVADLDDDDDRPPF